MFPRKIILLLLSAGSNRQTNRAKKTEHGEPKMRESQREREENDEEERGRERAIKRGIFSIFLLFINWCNTNMPAP